MTLFPYTTLFRSLVPKKEKAGTVNDFRPISIISLIPKILSKILANRLSPLLQELISHRQTAFLKGRLIAENFMVTRELLQHIASEKRPTVLAKVDFSRAFDSVQWDFLFNVMSARGFPDRWINWIKQLLFTSSSRLIVNDECTEYFQHGQGLRQGDPISPLLFLVAADVLQRMIKTANNLLHTPISPLFRNPSWQCNMLTIPSS